MTNRKARYFIEAIIHVLFWLGVYYALQSLNASSFSMVTYNNGKPTGGFNAHTLFPFGLPVVMVLMVLFYSNIFWLFKKAIRYKRHLLAVAFIAGWFALLFTINYFIVFKLAAPPGTTRHHSAATQLTVSFSVDTASSLSYHSKVVDTPKAFVPPPPPAPPNVEFSTEDWKGMQLVMVIIFLAVLGVTAAYFFIKEWVNNNLARSHAEASQLDTEIRFLRSQVNPHFLFNTLNNLFSMAQKKDNDELADSILKLSGMMRYMIYESNTGSVPLQKEIDYLQDCIALNKLRYADNEVSVNFNYPAANEVAGVQVAPMLFIPFVENAFKHGVMIGRDSAINVAIFINQKKLNFTCENTNYSTVKKLQEEKTGIGLENVRRRLQLVYPGRHVLQAGAEGGKYCIKLEINIA